MKMGCDSTFMQKFARVVSKEMDRYGFDLDIVRTTATGYNPATSGGTMVETLFPCRGILFDLTLQSNGDSTKLGTKIEMGDKQLLIQPCDDDGFYQDNETGQIYPNKDRVKINGKYYQVITFKQLNPSTQDSVIWECYIRG